MYVIDSPHIKMTFCPTYSLALKVVEHYKKYHPDYSINKKSIKKYWSDTWLFTQYGFRIPSRKEELISIAISSYRHLAILTEGKLWDTDWFIKIEPAILYLFHEAVQEALKNSQYDFHNIECKDSILCICKNDLDLVVYTLKSFNRYLNQQRKEKDIFI